MNTKTTVALKPADVEQKWIVIDAKDAVVGRLASFIALRLRGKHRPDYTPNVDCGDHVIVVNAHEVKFTGRKLEQKIYYRHTGHPGGVKQRKAGQVLDGKFPERVLEKAVERMLPKESPPGARPAHPICASIRAPITPMRRRALKSSTSRR